MNGVAESLKTAPQESFPPASSLEAKILLEGLKPNFNTRHYHTAPRPRIPETNRHGVVVPIKPVSFNSESLTLWQREHGTKDSLHHLCWPKKAFENAGELADTYRKNRLNTVVLPRFQHVRYHRRHDRFIERYPTYLIPPDEVMVTFLDEAANHELLGHQIKRLDNLIEGVDDFTQETLEAIAESKEKARILCNRVASSEIIFPTFVQAALKKASRYVPLDFQDQKLN